MSIGLWLARAGLSLIALTWAGNLLTVLRKRREARWRIGPDSPGPGPGADGGPVRVCVVIPARNEAAHIVPCVEAALAQDLPGLVVRVLDDGSTDGTGALLADLAERWPGRLQVQKGGDQPLPPGWLGKPWACQRAARDVDAEWILFIDADVRLRPHAVGAAVAWAQDKGLALLSGLGHMDTGSFWERVMQPAVGALIMAGNDLDRVNDPTRRSDRPLANGQFLLFHAPAYRAIGGHEAVAGAVLDDVGMATAIVGAGLPYNILMMRELFSCRMYDSLGALWEGWSKNLFTGIRRSFGVLIFLTVWLSLVSLLPFLLAILGVLGLVGTEWMWWGLGLSAFILAVRAFLDLAYDMDPRYGPTQPLAVFLLIALLWSSALRTLRGTASWKGRVLALDPGESARTTASLARDRAAGDAPAPGAQSPEDEGPR